MKFAYSSGDQPLEGYTIKRGVGIGGFGEVYFATSDAGKELALKQVQRNLDIEVRGVTQCLNLKHPNLIALYDIKYDDHGSGWIVMEYVPGESLKEVIDRNPNGMPADQIRLWFEGIAAGVAYLHDHGIVHRDLKPGNIFDDEGVVKIGDYGLSKFISCSRRSGQTESVGTFHYMAPEIGKGVYGKEIDVYALGIMLYEMLTGRVPFEGESSQEIMMKHLTADPDLSGIDNPYREVIRRALLKDPEQRFSNVHEMLTRLKFNSANGTAVREEAVVSATVVAETSPKPPIQTGGSGTLHITEENADEIVFGPVKRVTPTEPPHRPVSNSRPPVARQQNGEPIANAVRGGWKNTRSWWAHSHLSGPAKLLILVAAAFLVIINSQWLIPAGIVFGAVYLVYFGIRSIILAMTEAPAAELARDPGAARQRVRRRKWQEFAREGLQQKRLTDNAEELTGSFLVAAIASGLIGLAMMVMAGQSFSGSVQNWVCLSWLVLSSVAGAWVVLFAGKFWEANDGEQLTRRFVMLVSGLLVGLVVFGGTQFLNVELAGHELTSAAVLHEMYPGNMFNGGEPTLSAYMVFFAGLFAILRWWRQADPLRSTRFSLWATLVTVVWSLVLPLPQPWGMMVAASMSVSVQMAAPWMRPKQRIEFEEQALA